MMVRPRSGRRAGILPASRSRFAQLQKEGFELRRIACRSNASATILAGTDARPTESFRRLNPSSVVWCASVDILVQEI